MKMRLDFVTNSSSTSYIIYFNQKIATKREIKSFIKNLFQAIQNEGFDCFLIKEYLKEDFNLLYNLEKYLIDLSDSLDSKDRLDNWILDEGSCWDWEINVYNFIRVLSDKNILPKDWLRCKFV